MPVDDKYAFCDFLQDIAYAEQVCEGIMGKMGYAHLEGGAVDAADHADAVLPTE